METVAVSFFILFGSSYGVSSVLLRKNIRIHDTINESPSVPTRIYSEERKKEFNLKSSPKRDDWFV